MKKTDANLTLEAALEAATAEGIRFVCSERINIQSAAALYTKNLDGSYSRWEN